MDCSNICKSSVIFFWIIFQAEVISQQQYEPVYHRFFRCNNGKYIDQRWFCDGDMKDCGDGSEESFGCSPQKCGTARFACYNDSSCVDITSRCNTLANCPDGSDEWFCGEETNIDECSLHKGKYRCRDNLKCIDFNYTCDGSCNCFDCSDEHTTNCAKFDSESCKTCPHYCLPTPNGPQCICNSSNYEMSKLCKEIENCTGSSDCEQHCTRYKNVTRCLCYEDHHEVFYPEGIKCRSNVWLENVLIYSTLTKIKALYVISNETQIIKNGVESDLLTAARRYIYYMIRVHNTYNIFKVSISGGEATKVTESDLPLTSIAVDWITNNVYFTTNQSLSVCSNDGRVCVQLQCCDVDYVTLAAQHGIMFFTKNSRGKVQQLIMRSNLDGSEKEALLDVSFHHPISLVADEWTKTLYWFELKTGRMYSSSFDASNKEMNDKILLNLGQVTSFIFSVLDREYFIVVNHTNRIHSVEGTRRYRDINTNTLRFLYAYNPTLQSTYEIENVCEKASCNGLCLLRSKPLTSDLDHSCLCEDAASKNGSQTCYIYNQMSSEGDKSPTESSLVVPSSTTSQPPCQWNFLKGIFYYIFSAVFIIGILAFYYVLCKINQNKRNQTINISERFEL